jgi:outer membrane protein OmpA-like peptidoglycan-associated protein
MKPALSLFFILLFQVFSCFAQKETKTVLFGKEEFKELSSKNLLLNKAIEYAIGKPDKQNPYVLEIIKAELDNGSSFEYYPGDRNKKDAFHEKIISSASNTTFSFKVYLDKKKSTVNKITIPNLENDYSFVVKVAVVGNPKIFVTEAANRKTFFTIIDEKSFTDKAFKKFFGENPGKFNYNISFDKMNACLIKNISTGECAEQFDGASYDKFSEKVSSAEYSGGFILIDLHVIREKSKLTNAIDAAIIKEDDGSEHLKFYFCIPRDNVRKLKKEFTIEGRLSSGGKTPVKGQTVYLRDGANIVIATQTTDAKGNFKFEKVKQGSGYNIMTDKSYSGPALFLHDKNDTQVGQFTKTEIGSLYKLLDQDIVVLSSETDNPANSFPSFQGKMLSVTDKIKPLANQVIELKNSGNNQVIQSQKTDGNGNFTFTKVDPKGNYSIELPNYTAVSKTEKVYLANTKNELLREFKRGANNKFSYKIVPADMQLLTSLQEDDPEMTFKKQKNANTNEIVIHDFIYFNVNSFQISPQSKITLDKIAKIVSDNADYKMEIVSHTDCRGETIENQKLSEKRSEAVMNYLISKNIEAARLKSTGMGESKPLNNCTDGSHCLEDEYKMNRRTEFRFYK